MSRRSYIDQMGEKISCPFPPKRIVSLVPSQTELLAALDLDHAVVGITRFCVRPNHWFKSKTRIGGTKNFDLPTIESLRPDLIIGNKEENYSEGIRSLKQKYPVWMSDIYTLQDAFDMMKKLGEITDRLPQAVKLVTEISHSFKALNKPFNSKALYLIWRKPWMAAGRDTFIDHIMGRIGLNNVLTTTRYPEISMDEMKALQPEVILLSSEPFPFREKHAQELKVFFPHTSILLVDGEMFSWYGSRLLLACDYFKSLRS